MTRRLLLARTVVSTVALLGFAPGVLAQENHVESVTVCAALAATLGESVAESSPDAAINLQEMAKKWLVAAESAGQQSSQVESVRQRFGMILGEMQEEFERQLIFGNETVDRWFDRLDDCILEVSDVTNEEQ